MSEPEIDHNDPDTESMFDFLAEDDNPGRVRKKNVKQASERPLPIIRKPVPVSESGPLRPPGRGAPVEPPPPLTDATAAADTDDFDFLNDLSNSARVKQVPVKPERTLAEPSNSAPQSAKVSRNNVTPLTAGDARTRRAASASSARARSRSAHSTSRSRSDFDLDALDLDLDDQQDFPTDWSDGIHTESLAANDETSKTRVGWLALAFMLIVAGVGSFLYTNPPAWLEPWIPVQALNQASVPSDAEGTDPQLGDDEPTDITAPISSSPLMEQFRAQLTRIEALVEAGSLNDAEQAIANMDRTVYGYGAFEFSELEARITQLKSGDVVSTGASQAEQEEQARQAAQAEQEEQARQAAAQAQAEQEEQARQAAAQAQAEQEEQARQAAQAAQVRAEQEEQARQAAQAAQVQAEQEEQARQAAQAAQARAEQEEQARQAAQLRLAEQQAAQIKRDEELDRLAEREAVEASRLENARVQEAMRAAQAAQALVAAQEKAKLDEQTPAVQAIDADRQATDRRIAEERAALQRQRAREQRLTEAREREAARNAQALQSANAETVSVENGNQTSTNQTTANETPLGDTTTTEAPVLQPSETVAFSSQTITDDDLQLVYRQFSNLQQAVRDRDIGSVIELTQRSGVRVQQFMQMFENSVEIDARIRNVSTRNATGEIRGTLQINKVRRADGLVTEPPVNLSAIPLTSRREASGWSAIQW